MCQSPLITQKRDGKSTRKKPNAPVANGVSFHARAFFLYQNFGDFRFG